MKTVLNRAELKAKAKGVLKGYYWLFFLVSLLVYLLSGNVNSGTGSRNNARGLTTVSSSHNHSNSSVSYTLDVPANTQVSGIVAKYGYNTFNGTLASNIARFVLNARVAIISILIVLISFCYALLVAYPVKVGGSKIYIDSSSSGEKPQLKQLGYAFKSGRYMNTVKAGFLTSIYTFFWLLLFFIPGIVKAISYSMVPYILADNPDMDASSAIRLSMAMTKGHKTQIFVTGLSFIGWYFLGSLLFGLGVYFVNPYVDATYTQIYIALKNNAIDTGLACPENFGVTEPIPYPVSEFVDYRDQPREN